MSIIRWRHVRVGRPTVSRVNLNSPAKNNGLITYSREELLSQKKKKKKELLSLRSKFFLPNNLYMFIRNEGILKTRRTRAGNFEKSRNRRIKQRITPRYLQSTSRSSQGVNPANLCNIPVNLCNIPSNKTSSDALDRRPDNLQICLLNARSLKNKSTSLLDYIFDRKPDIVAISETWFNENDSTLKVTCTPPGYYLLDQSRKDRKGGGIAVLVKDILVGTKAPLTTSYRSFEYCEVSLKVRSFHFKIIVMYMPPYSIAHPVTVAHFVDEFTAYLESTVLIKEPVIIMGDFNLHVDDPSDTEAKKVCDMLDSLGLEQHVKHPTHIQGHTLELVITRCCDSLLC